MVASIVYLMKIYQVKFNPTLALSNLLASTSISGALAVWNVERATDSERGYWTPDVVLREHSQAVNSVCWHYGNPQTLLTGSHDTKIKLWDLRVKNMSTLTFNPKSSYVRDLQFRKTLSAQRFVAALVRFFLVYRLFQSLICLCPKVEWYCASVGCAPPEKCGSCVWCA
jgi:WD40 repeat protein